MNFPHALFQARCRGQKFYCLLAAEIPENYHRARSGWNWAAHAVDWLGNCRIAGKYVVQLFGDNIARCCLDFAYLCLGLDYYILARISKCRCAKRQRDKRDAASSHPTNQARQPEWCFHIWIMRHFWAQHNDNRNQFSPLIARENAPVVIAPGARLPPHCAVHWPPLIFRKSPLLLPIFVAPPVIAPR